MLKPGDPAPEFCLMDAQGNSVCLSQFRGKKIVLYFYPKDHTPGCTKQACAFRDTFEDFQSIDAVVIGISRDTPASHQKFIDKNGLPFLLLSDPQLSVLQAYDVWQEKKLYGKTAWGTVRSMFILDEEGRILKTFYGVKAQQSAQLALEALKNVSSVD